MKYLIDTGVLLRVVDRNSTARPEIVSALRSLRAAGDEIITSTQNLREFWNVSTRPAEARGGYGRNVEQTSRWVRTLGRVIRIVGETDATFALWMTLVEHYQVIGSRVHDAHLVAIMQSNGINGLVTLDPHDFRRYQSIQVATPAELARS